MSEESEMSGVAQVADDCDARRLEFANLFKARMEERSITLTKMRADGIISERRKRGFFKHVADGKISTAEFDAICEYLDIDPLRAHLAIQCFKRAEAYNDPCCETSFSLVAKIATQLPVEIAACSGNFEPVRDSICKNIADQTTNAISAHHQALERRRTDPEHFAKLFG